MVTVSRYRMAAYMPSPIMKIEIAACYHLTELSEKRRRFIEKGLTLVNPKYQEALRQGRYVGNIPKEIRLFERLPEGLSVPRGISLEWLAPDECSDLRHLHPVVLPAIIQLRPYQERAVDEARAAGGGLMVAPTGAGKTTMALVLAHRLGQRTLVLVRSLDLAHQWQEAVQRFTGLSCGIIGGGKWKEGNEITVALIQTLVRHDTSLDYGMLIVDEAHNTPALQAYTVINRQAARYRYGLSATPQRRDRLEALIHASIGPVVTEITAAETGESVLPVKVTVVGYPCTAEVEGWGAFLQWLAEEPGRNAMIAQSAIRAASTRGTVILTSTIAHAEVLYELVMAMGHACLLLHGQLPRADRLERMALAPESPLIISTLSLLSEGIDLPHVGALIFAAPVSADIAGRESPAATRLIQSIGRTRRPYPGKTVAHVMDIVDHHPLGVSAYRKRLEVYRRLGFAVHESQPV